MAKVPILLDLVSGILLALELFPKFDFLTKIHDKIRDFIKEIDTNNFISRRSIMFSSCISILLFLVLLLWVYYTNRDKLNYDVWGEIGWFSVGIVISWLLITLLAKLLKKNGTLGIFIAGLFVSFIAFVTIFSLHPSNSLATATTSFIYISFLYPFGMLVAHNVQRFLLQDEKRQFYIFALLGIMLFVLGKILELSN